MGWFENKKDEKNRRMKTRGRRRRNNYRIGVKDYECPKLYETKP